MYVRGMASNKTQTDSISKPLQDGNCAILCQILWEQCTRINGTVHCMLYREAKRVLYSGRCSSNYFTHVCLNGLYVDMVTI